MEVRLPSFIQSRVLAIIKNNMKKIFALLAAIMLFASCSKKDYEATITYRIYYPGNTVTRSYTMEATDHPGYILASNRGSNYLVIMAGGSFSHQEKLEDTSAPIEVVSFTRKKK